MGRTDSRNWLTRTLVDGPGSTDLALLDRLPAFERSLSRLVGYTAMLFTVSASAYLLFR